MNITALTQLGHSSALVTVDILLLMIDAPVQVLLQSSDSNVA